MSTPLTAPKPDMPTGSSNPVSWKSWFIKIGDWINGLSPSGATVYDTGWVAITLASGVSGFIRSRRVGVMIEIDVNVTGTFPVGVTTIALAGAVPISHRPANQGNRRGPGALNGNPGMLYIVGSTGLLGVINQTGSSRTSVDGQIQYFID